MLPTRPHLRSKFGGASSSARIESPHFAAGTDTYPNLYVIHCAGFLDACLRASSCAANARLRMELQSYYGVDTSAANDVQIAIPAGDILTGLNTERLPAK